MLGALEAFEEKAPQGAKSALMLRCPEIRKTLEDMIGAPGSYVTKATPDVKASPEENKDVEKKPTVRIIDKGKPVIDHHVIESINHKIKKIKQKTKS